jgi:hypothetical protein
VYFTAAVFLVCFEDLTKIPDISMTIVMEAFPLMMGKLDVRRLAALSAWVYQTVHADETFVLEGSGNSNSEILPPEQVSEWFRASHQ